MRATVGPGRERLHRIEDLGVAGAATEVADQTCLDLLATRVRLLRQHGPGRQDHAGRADAALDGAGPGEGLLDLVEPPVAAREPLHRRDLAVSSPRHREQARQDGYAVEQHGARAAASLAAPRLRRRVTD